MEGRKLLDLCAFDKLFKINAPHTFEAIFLSLDYESLKKCREVSYSWMELITSRSFQDKTKYVFAQGIHTGRPAEAIKGII